MHLSSSIIKLAILGISGVSCLNSFPGSHVQIDRRSIADIYKAAQKEVGTLKIAYGGDETAQGFGVIQAFAKAFPAIKFELTVDLSKYHSSRINRAIQRGEKYADVAVLQTLNDFDVWKRYGYLLPYKPANFDSLFTEVKDADGAWLPLHIASFGTFVWNAKKTGSAKIPTSYVDLLDPQWKSKLVITYPNDDDAINFLFAQIIERYGWGWFEALAKQDVQWVRGTQTPATLLLGNGKRSLSISTFPLPGLNITAPISDQFLSWPQSSAILTQTNMPESAKLFVTFLYSDAFQNSLSAQGGYSTRKDLGLPVWNVSNTDASSFHRFMLQRDVAEFWRSQYETTLGTAQGLSPLIDGI